jgi:hypothetical protein
MRTYGLFSALARARAGYNQGQAAGDQAREAHDLAEASQLAQMFAQQRAAAQDRAQLGLQRDRLTFDQRKAADELAARQAEADEARAFRASESAAARDATATSARTQRDFVAQQNEANRQNARALADIARQGRQQAGARQASAQEVRLAGQYGNNPVVKDAYDMAQNLEKIRISGQRATAAGDVSMVFNYMKMLDPGSTVREGEQAQARQATGVPDRVLNLYNWLVAGNTLTPKQRADFATTAEQLARGQQSQVRPVMKRYGAAARRISADSAFVAPDPFEASGLDDPRTAPGGVPAATTGPIDLSRFGLEPPAARRARP